MARTSHKPIPFKQSLLQKRHKMKTSTITIALATATAILSTHIASSEEQKWQDGFDRIFAVEDASANKTQNVYNLKPGDYSLDVAESTNALMPGITVQYLLATNWIAFEGREVGIISTNLVCTVTWKGKTNKMVLEKFLSAPVSESTDQIIYIHSGNTTNWFLPQFIPPRSPYGNLLHIVTNSTTTTNIIAPSLD